MKKSFCIIIFMFFIFLSTLSASSDIQVKHIYTLPGSVKFHIKMGKMSNDAYYVCRMKKSNSSGTIEEVLNITDAYVTYDIPIHDTTYFSFDACWYDKDVLVCGAGSMYSNIHGNYIFGEYETSFNMSNDNFTIGELYPKSSGLSITIKNSHITCTKAYLIGPAPVNKIAHILTITNSTIEKCNIINSDAIEIKDSELFYGGIHLNGNISDKMEYIVLKNNQFNSSGLYLGAYLSKGITVDKLEIENNVYNQAEPFVENTKSIIKNLTIKGNTYDDVKPPSILIINAEKGVVDNNTIKHLNIDNSSNLTITNNDLLGWMILRGVKNSIIKNNKLEYFSLEDCSGNIITDHKLVNTNNGSSVPAVKLLGNSKNNIIKDNEFLNYYRGIETGCSNTYYDDKCLKCITNNEITNNVFDADQYGLYLKDCVRDNKIYNNSFTKHKNLYFFDIYSIDMYKICGNEKCTNQYYTEPLKGANIVGGPKIGGNYYQDPDFNCNDSNHDGFCDNEYKIYPDKDDSDIDKYPLYLPKVFITSGDSNSINSPWSSKKEPMKVMNLKLINNKTSEGDVDIKSMSFNFKGSGSVDDIDKVTLYKDETCSGGSLVKIFSGSFTGNSINFSNINTTVSKGSECCFSIEYKLKNQVIASKYSIKKSDYCPCSVYGIEIKGEDVKAEMNGSDKYIYGLVSGSVNANYPLIEFSDENNKNFIEPKNTKIKKPLSVKLDNLVKTNSYNQWKAVYEITKEPVGVSGDFLESSEGKGKKIEILFNSSGVAQCWFTTGDKTGEYIVSVSIEPTEDNPYNCPVDTVSDTLDFTIFTGGIKLKADFDGSSGGDKDYLVSTFISGIEAKNKLIASFELPSTSPKPKSVTFSPSWSESVTDSEEPFEAEIDMKHIGDSSKLLLTGILEDGTEFKEEYNFYAIQLPEWVNTFNGFPYNGLKWEFDKSSKAYKLNFNFPDDFAWNNPIPSDFPVIGQEENDENFQCEASAFYYINQESDFSGKGSFSGEILGNEIDAEGEIKISFDKEFLVKETPPPTGIFSGNACFETDMKNIGSKTVVVYGVPITLAVEAGGKLTIFAAGKLIFHKTLKLKDVSFIPGITVTLIIDASATAAFGVAKIGVRSEPTGIIKIKLKYTTAEGKATEEAFGGEFSVPVTVYGSLFWDKINGDLASTEFGPWTFGDDVGEAAYIKKSMIKKSSGKKYYSTGASAVSEDGNSAVVYTDFSEYSEPCINYQTDFGYKGLIDSTSSGFKWEIDPSLTFLSGKKLLAVWTSNDAPKDTAKLNEIFNHQDIAYSYFNGSDWSNEGLIIDDENSDGLSDVTYDKNNKAMAVWVHNSKQEEEFTLDKTKYSIYYATFDEESLSWSVPEAIPGTNTGLGDFMPKVIGIGQNKFMVLWIRDNDGKLFKISDNMTNGSNVNTDNNDCNVYYSVYTAGSWSSPASVTSANSFTETMVSGCYNKNIDKSLAVWVTKHEKTQILYISEYSGSSWSPPVVVDSAKFLIESPTVSLSDDNIATVVYRKKTGLDEGLFKAEKDMSDVTTSAEDKTTQITEGVALWNSSRVMKNGKIKLVWTDSSVTGKNNTAEYSSEKTAKIGDNITAELFKNSDKWGGVKVVIPISITKQGDYRVCASLYKNNQLIEKKSSDNLTFAVGEHKIFILFSGSYIKSKGYNGPYQVRDIKLMKCEPSNMIADSSSLVVETENCNVSDFSGDEILSIDKDIYMGDNTSMIVTVHGIKANGSVYVSSSNNKGKEFILDKISESVYKGSVNLSDLYLNDGDMIFVVYVDIYGNIFQKTAIWIEEPPKIYELTVKIDNYTGENRVTGIEGGIKCPSNCYETVKGGETITITEESDNNSEFIGWDILSGDNVTCDNNSIDCTFTMNGNSEVRAVFKKKEKEFIEDNSGDLTEIGVKVKRAMLLFSGWNLISIPVDDIVNTGEKFANANTIWGWTGASWEVWSPKDTIVKLLNQYKITILSKMESGKGYWINAESSFSENFQGVTYGKDKLSMVSGWNLLGIGVKLSSSEFSAAKTLWRWTGASWEVWSPESTIINLLNQYKITIANEIKGGEGFWVNK